MVFFRDDKDDGDEGLKGEGQPLIRFQSRTGVQAANCGLKKSFGFLIVRRAKKLNYGRTKKVTSICNPFTNNEFLRFATARYALTDTIPNMPTTKKRL